MTDVLLAQNGAREAGSWTRREILQQPQTLLATQALLTRDREVIDAFIDPLLIRPELRIVLTGAGTSAFIGDSVAPWLSKLLGRTVESIATTDIVSAPDLHLRHDTPLLLVSFGRSGNSPESLAAVDLADARVAETHHLIITCNAAGALAKRASNRSHLIVLPEATHDRGFAMTSSFSAMTLAAIIAFSNETNIDGRVAALAGSVEAITLDSDDKMQALAARDFKRVVYLGSGPFKGLAREAALKLLELSDGQLVTAFDTALGFRHGPKTIVDATTLVVVFVANDPLTRRYDLDIIDELRSERRCGALLTISAQPDDNPDLFASGLARASDIDLLFPFIVPAQLFALHVSTMLGLTPDTPNASGTVNRVVQGVRIYTDAP